MGLPTDLRFHTKGQLAIDICADAYADGVRFDVICGDEVYGGCTQLRKFFEQQQQAYVLRVACTYLLDVGGGVRLTCQQAVKHLVGPRQSLATCAVAAAQLHARTDRHPRPTTGSSTGHRSPAARISRVMVVGCPSGR